MTRRHGPAALLLVLALSGSFAACTRAPPEAVAEPTPVRVARARPGPATPAIATNGVVAAKDEMRLSFKVGGIVRQIHVQEGQRVRRGERLAGIELAEVDAQLEQAAQLAAKAQRDLERGERLYDDQVISLEQLQDLRTQAAVAQAQARGVQFNRSHAVIVAPYDGVVLRRLVEEREFVPAGQTVLVVSGADRGYVVRTALADREIVRVRIGDAAEIHMDAFPGRVLGGKVSEVSHAAESASGLFPLEVRFDATTLPLASGLVAKLSISPAAAGAANLAYVPLAAIVEGDGARASVFVVRDGHAVRRDVKVAFIAADGVALADGVSIGETVVTDGALYLANGDPIAIVK
ncbi:MAG: efflux RND transporter periplasmic adaptor subunit [Steroidobacteraceae bacterium]